MQISMCAKFYELLALNNKLEEKLLQRKTENAKDSGKNY